MKYKFTGEIKIELGVTLKRIVRISDGDLGGWIEDEKNLSQEDDAWVFGDASVFGDARVYGNAWVFGDARVLHGYQCIFAANLQFHITVTPQNIVIGCYLRTYKEWMNLTCDEAVELGLERRNYKTFRELLKIFNKEATRNMND